MAPPGHSVPPRPPWSLIGPGVGAVLAAGVLTAPVGPLTEAIQRDLGLSSAALTTILAVQYAAAAVALFAPGHLLGRRAPTATALPGLVLVLVGTLVSAFAPGAAVMAAGRVLAGLGAGTAAGAALALSTQLATAPAIPSGPGAATDRTDVRRSPARLVLLLALGAALVLGPVAGGVVVRALSWRTAFVAELPVALFGLLAAAASGVALLVARGSRPGPPLVQPPATPFPGGPAR
ncbi:MFS transporter [Dactylosporangium sp. AC04546]|uniref:MFS transporter n=1 Tax=Dactylosporangium sp. AC04546 TaxID=2862460 RepID=UPI001EDD122C|nr:MFS transporter [Dactylosporangium sp. AC04546]WVK86302.1 MFS transporter [Dactylosporangium sp. AC04546]